MDSKDQSRRNKDDSEGDFDDKDFDPEDFEDGEVDDDPLGNDDTSDGESADEDGSGGMEADDSDEEMPDYGDDDDFDGEPDNEFDDDEDYEEGLLDKPVILYSIIAFIFLIIVAGVGAGAWFFISTGEDTIAEEQMDQEVMSATTLPLSSPESAEGTEEAASGSTPSLNDIAAAGDLPEEAAVSATTTTSTGQTGQEAANASLSSIVGTGSLNALAGGGTNALSSVSSTGAGLIIPASTVTGFQSFVDYPSPSPLPRAPDADFLEVRGNTLSPLPKIAADGRPPWEFYGRPFVPDSGTKRVAIVVTGMGLSTAETLAAIRKLPPEITLSYSPYAEDLEQWLLRSRRVGHEVMLGLPLESGLFPIEDSGPMALKSGLSAEENTARLEEIMSVFQGYMGLEIVMGSKFTANELLVRNLLGAINGRGLMVLDGAWNNRSLVPKIATEIGMPRAVSSVRLDSVMAGAAIDAKIKELDTLVLNRNQAIATTGMSPGVMGRLKTWLQTLPDRGIKLVPLSSLVDVSVPAEAN